MTPESAPLRSLKLDRILPPLILAAALSLAGLAGARGGTVNVAPFRVDPDADAAWALRSLEGLGDEGARAIAAARRIAPIDAPSGLTAVPGVGPRRLHRWHGDLDFRKERR
jgi:hypothetical protein